MKFFAVATFLATSVAALPSSTGTNHAANQLTLKQAQDKCGNEAKVSCCNKKIESGDSYEKNEGLLSGGILNNLLGGNKGSQGLGVFDQCSELSVTGLLGLNDVLSDQCKQNIACCDGSNANAEGGLVNIALPCVVIQDVL